MLILTRKPGESLYIGDVKVTVVELKGHQVRIGIDAPPEIRIYREEIYLQIMEENRKAAEAGAEGGLEGLPMHWKGKPVAGEAAQSGGDSGGSGDEGQPKKPGIANLASFSKPLDSTGANVEHRSADTPSIVIKRKRKKIDE
jgi:carbon storage regulator